MKELIFKYDSAFIVWYDDNTNLPLPDNFHDDYFTEAVGVISKCVIDHKKLNLKQPREADHVVAP